MSDKYLDILKQKVVEFMKDEDVQVILFGSRAKQSDTRVSVSDVDIGIIPGNSFDRRKLVFLREYLEESTIPYKVEVVDFSMVSEEFRRLALKDAEVWKS